MICQTEFVCDLSNCVRSFCSGGSKSRDPFVLSGAAEELANHGGKRDAFTGGCHKIEAPCADTTVNQMLELAQPIVDRIDELRGAAAARMIVG